MNPGEHALMSQVEGKHWWYLGLRDCLRRCLERPDLALPPRPRLLDAGCGTGENLRLLGEIYDPEWLGGFDLSPEAVELARAKAPHAEVSIGDLCDPPESPGPLDLIISMDVLCIPGVERARAGMVRLARSLAPGGLLLLHLPAYRWLRGEHDAAVHTSERYTASEVATLVRSLGLEPCLVSYRLCPLLPPIAIARALSRRRQTKRGGPAQSDLHRLPGPLQNRALAALLAGENRLIAGGVRMPWGSSVLTIGRRTRHGAASASPRGEWARSSRR